MLFCETADVNEVWSVVATAVANNELGIAAKVTPEDGQGRKPRLICIYTKDFTDLKDVSRVLNKMKELGLVDSREKPIYYKCGESCCQPLNVIDTDMFCRCVHLSRAFIRQPVQYQSLAL